MPRLVDEVAAKRGLTPEIFDAHDGQALGEWVIVKPLRAPSTVDGVWTGVEKKDGAYEQLHVVVSAQADHRLERDGVTVGFVSSLPVGAVVAIVRQLAVKLQDDGELLAVKAAHVIAVMREGGREQPDST